MLHFIASLHHNNSSSSSKACMHVHVISLFFLFISYVRQQRRLAPYPSAAFRVFYVSVVHKVAGRTDGSVRNFETF